MSHTQAPWEVSAGDVWPRNGNPRVKIANIVKPSPMNNIDWEANARLIAAAPDMVEALQWVQKWIIRHALDKSELINGQMGEVPILGTIRAALAKAGVE